MRGAWISAMVLIPLFGFWLASSLAAYNNASQWFSLVVGLLLFPLVPVGWDLFFVWRRSKRPPRPAILTRLDRLVMRTLIVNAIFLGGMMYFARHTAFRSLAPRGDCFLDGRNGVVAETIRDWLLGFGDRFDRRSEADHYGKSDDASDVKPPQPPPPPTPEET